MSALPPGARSPSPRRPIVEEDEHTIDMQQTPNSHALTHQTSNVYSHTDQDRQSNIALSPPARPNYQHRSSSQTSECGFFKNAFKTRMQASYMIVGLVESVVVMTLIGIVFVKIENRILTDANDNLRSIQVYLGIFILAVLFLLLVSFDALRLHNVLQLQAIIVFSLSMLIYGALSQTQIRDALLNANPNGCNGPNAIVSCPGGQSLFDEVNGLIIAVPSVLALGTVIRAVLTFYLWKEFGWEIFQALGASLSIRRMYQYYQYYVVFLKFDVFFFLGFSLQFLILVPGIPAVELGLTIAALPITIAAIILAAVSVRKESRWGMVLYAIFIIVAMTYFIYKLVRIYQPSQSSRYSSNRRSLSLFSIVSLLMLLCTALISIRLYLNFGKGLSRAIPPYRKQKARVLEGKEENARPEID